jgi:hypothetical protein
VKYRAKRTSSNAAFYTLLSDRASYANEANVASYGRLPRMPNRSGFVCASSGISAFGLIRKTRIGVVFLFVTEFFIFILPPLIDATYPPTGFPKHPVSAYGTGNILLYATILNVFNFRRRCGVLGPGLEFLSADSALRFCAATTDRDYGNFTPYCARNQLM